MTNATQLIWNYTAVMHTPESTKVHRAAYDAAGNLVTVSPAPETLSDVTPNHLFTYLTQVLCGLANRPAIDAATFAEKSQNYAAICAEENT